MPPNAGVIEMRQFVAGIGLLLLAACGPTGQQRTVALLHQRLHARMAGAMQTGAATVQDLPDGALVSFPERRFVTAGDPRIDMVEAMLDPSLLRIAVVPPSNLPPYEAAQRVQAWTTEFSRMQIGPALRPPSITPSPVPYSTTVVIQVVCPAREGSMWNYHHGEGEKRPGCR